MHLFARYSLQLKTLSSHDKAFLTKGFIKNVIRGYALSPRMKKGIFVPLPLILAGFGKIDPKSSEK
jgi:hypothetical protein